jgi:hypothetical protein
MEVLANANGRVGSCSSGPTPVLHPVEDVGVPHPQYSGVQWHPQCSGVHHKCHNPAPPISAYRDPSLWVVHCGGDCGGDLDRGLPWPMSLRPVVLTPCLMWLQPTACSISVLFPSCDVLPSSYESPSSDHASGRVWPRGGIAQGQVPIVALCGSRTACWGKAVLKTGSPCAARRANWMQCNQKPRLRFHVENCHGFARYRPSTPSPPVTRSQGRSAALGDGHVDFSQTTDNL